MNKAQLVKSMSDKSGLSPADTKRIIEAYMEIVTECMTRREEVVLVGFGTLVPWPQMSRLARNPKTGEPVMIKPRTSVKFKPGKYLLQSINGR